MVTCVTKEHSPIVISISKAFCSSSVSLAEASSGQRLKQVQLPHRGGHCLVCLPSKQTGKVLNTLSTSVCFCRAPWQRSVGNPKVRSLTGAGALCTSRAESADVLSDGVCGDNACIFSWVELPKLGKRSEQPVLCWTRIVTAGRAFPVPGLAGLNPFHVAFLNSLSAANLGDCIRVPLPLSVLGVCGEGVEEGTVQRRKGE